METCLWLLVFFFLLQPAIENGMLAAARVQMLARLEAKRSSKVIALVRRQEQVNFLGFTFLEYINMEDSESIMRAIRMTDPTTPIDLIIHSPGSDITAAEQISAALIRHPANVTVFVPHYAMSGAALIALAASELVMNQDAVLGAPEPEVGMFPANSILKAVASKSVSEVEDKTWMMAQNASKARDQIRSKTKEILGHRMDAEKAERIAETLTSGRWTVDYPLSVDELIELGLSVSTDMPLEVYQLMNLYPQPRNQRPSVQFIQAPYRKSDRKH